MEQLIESSVKLLLHCNKNYAVLMSVQVISNHITWYLE